MRLFHPRSEAAQCIMFPRIITFCQCNMQASVGIIYHICVKYIPKYANVQICDKELLGCLKLSRIIYKYFNLQNTRENKLANIENIIRLISIYYDSLIPTNIFQFYNIQPLQLQFSRLFVQFN